MLINDILGRNKPFNFRQKRLNVNGRVYSYTKLIADVLNYSFVTLAQANFTPIGPSEATVANIKKNLRPRQVNYVFRFASNEQ